MFRAELQVELAFPLWCGLARQNCGPNTCFVLSAKITYLHYFASLNEDFISASILLLVHNYHYCISIYRQTITIASFFPINRMRFSTLFNFRVFLSQVWASNHLLNLSLNYAADYNSGSRSLIVPWSESYIFDFYAIVVLYLRYCNVFKTNLLFLLKTNLVLHFHLNCIVL